MGVLWEGNESWGEHSLASSIRVKVGVRVIIDVSDVAMFGHVCKAGCIQTWGLLGVGGVWASLGRDAQCRLTGLSASPTEMD